MAVALWGTMVVLWVSVVVILRMVFSFGSGAEDFVFLF